METPPLDLRNRLIKAIFCDETEAAIDCLQRGLDPGMCFGGERTMIPAFNLCVQKGRMGIVEALVQAGCSVNRPDSDGSTPLHDACVLFGSCPMTSYLLSRGASVNARDGMGNTPLLAAAIHGKLSLELLSGLVEAGSDVNCRTNDGRNVLHVCLTSKYDYTNLVEPMLSTPYRCDINATALRGITALHFAVFYSRFQSARMLIRAGCALECEDIDRLTPMGYALMFKRYRLIELLTAAGIVIPRPEWMKLRESLKDDPETLKTLMDVGADFPKLSNLCRRAFYEYFGAEARTRVQNMPVCPMIKKYLAFEIL